MRRGKTVTILDSTIKKTFYKAGIIFKKARKDKGMCIQFQCIHLFCKRLLNHLTFLDDG